MTNPTPLHPPVVKEAPYMTALDAKESYASVMKALDWILKDRK
jgi:hypothetical protein